MNTKFLIYVTIFLLITSCNNEKNVSEVVSENTQLNCDYNNLSDQFNVNFKINQDNNIANGAIEFVVQITDKKNNILKKITTQPKIIASEINFYKQCDQVKSLSKNYNISKQWSDKLYDGNIVVGDYNFDGKDDIAIYHSKETDREIFFYEYYLQTDQGDFERDNFLSDKFHYFGKRFDRKNKLLINDEHVIIDKYKYDYGWIKLVEAVSPNIESSFYMVSVAAVKTESDAKNEVIKLENKGYQANYLWIPDYASLSGAKFYSVYIGPFSTQQECEIATEEYRKKDKNAYGLLVSQEPKRVQINGVGKVTVTNN
ncbi:MULTISPECIES: SPOR domain-containing protein [Weeksellaceae]|nr:MULTISPECIES: SPOR domain-containing protein [Weeksellaceae]